LKGTLGTVTDSNFLSFFNVTNTSNGDVIFDNNADGWSVLLLGVHDSAQTLLANHTFIYA
jgi:hypothetical protein